MITIILSIKKTVISELKEAVLKYQFQLDCNKLTCFKENVSGLK